jgi:hypothetical protein
METKNKVGRPAKYLTNAEKQKAYRERKNDLKKTSGKISSKIIDLSAIPPWLLK